ncbi:MAG: hypothetical protein IV086_00945 [Hyphomonadaceae bacterium]|nr:MAG: hypothetical protein FD160_779 [Caulobacteraceae bacterium]MBT9444244.1 hypothetical protein [Hyphomonadaceae bacterium]TPW01759.1 MAG: hypothetical protein FD124_3623 [Alphaproteobacteria bacterium]
MRGVLAVLLGAALLAGCGPSGAPDAARVGADVCAMAPDTRAVFGAAVESESDPGVGTIAGGCRWRSGDGAVMGEAALFTPDSIAGDAEAATPQAMYAKLSGALEGLSEAPVEPVAGLGDEASRTQMAFGDQTQIVVRKGDRVLLVRASASNDVEKTNALAERLARALVDAPSGAPAK